MSTIQASKVLIANVRAALARPHEGLMCGKREKKPMVYRVGDASFRSARKFFHNNGYHHGNGW